MIFPGEDMTFSKKSFSFKLDFLNTNKSIKKTREGFLRLDAYVTRTGVFDYPEFGRKELRHPEEVLKQDSLDTMKNKSITFIHPNELVDSKNFRRYDVGVIG